MNPDDNKFLLTEEECTKKIKNVHQSEKIFESKKSKKMDTEYRPIRKYGILIVNGREKFIKSVQEEGENTVLYHVLFSHNLVLTMGNKTWKNYEVLWRD